MSEPTTQLPAEGKAAGNDEESVLLGYLTYYRAVLARKAEGISEAEARLAPCPPSTITLLGLIRHMAEVERGWFRNVLLDEGLPPVFADDNPDRDDDTDFDLPAHVTLAESLQAYWAEIEACDRNIAATPLDAVQRAGQQRASLRRIIVHMIEEYARHCGHADLIRQAIDGSTGD